MTQELLALLLLCLFAPLNAIISATANALVEGFAWGLGNRERVPSLPHWALRLQRSHANLIENLPSFIGVVLLAHVLAVHDEWTVMGAWIFVVARLVFVPVYVLGITALALRTVLYYIALGGLGLIATRILITVPLLT